MPLRPRTRSLLAFAALSATLSLPVAAQTPPLPEGMIGIHYSRCDKNYDGWGVHLWKKPNIPLPNIEWTKPMMPTGKSDFGVYWHVPVAEFGSSGTVNYIIHKGDNKEQGGADQRFESSASREVWVNGGDWRIYTSLEAATKARAEKPCP